jgi:hypothetical protein
MDNINLSGATFSGYDIHAYGENLSFINSNFNIAKATLSNSTSSIVSQNHNDSANDCQMVLHSAWDLSSVSGVVQTELETQNVTLYKNASYSPNLQIDVTNKTFGGLIIPAGSVVTHESTHAFTVTGGVDITGSGALYTGGTGVPTFGSLTIGASGTYSATSGITTLNGEGRGYNGYPSAIENQGTFTHNKGTILINGTGDQDIEMDGTGNFYNLTVNKSNNDLIHQANLVVENDLDVTMAAEHTLRPNATSGTATVYGRTLLTTGKIGAITAYDGTNNWGTLIINSGTFIVGSGTNNITSLRNLGGTIN